MTVIILALAVAYFAVGACVGVAYAVKSYRRNEHEQDPFFIMVPVVASFLGMLFFWPEWWLIERFMVFIKGMAEKEKAEERRQAADR